MSGDRGCPMTALQSPEPSERGEAASWAGAASGIAGWCAAIFVEVLPFKRARRLKPGRCNTCRGRRKAERLGEALLAQSLAPLLNREDLKRDDTQIQRTAPAISGGSCLRSRTAMTRCCLALARRAADLHAC